MELLLVNVNTTVAATDAMVAAARQAAAPGTTVTGLTPAFGADGVDSSFESLLSAVAVMDAVVSYDGGYDAVILGGFGEHGKEGLAELLEVPVFDIAECAAHVAMLLGRTYAIVTTLPRSIAQIEDRLLLAGLSARCATVLATGRTTRGLEDDPPAALAEIIDASRLAVRRDGAEVVVLGCGGMAGWAAEVSSAVGVPVVDGIPAAVALAEGVVGLGLRTSKVGAYAPPPGNVVTGWPLSRRGVQG